MEELHRNFSQNIVPSLPLSCHFDVRSEHQREQGSGNVKPTRGVRILQQPGSLMESIW
jgi:hypothetical protein